MTNYNIRNGLKKCLDDNTLYITVFGGSISEQNALHNWPDQFASLIKHENKKLNVVLENYAIGATTSDLAATQFKKLCNKNTDVIFIEFAVNDFSMDSKLRYQTREGLIQQAILHTSADIILVHTYCGEMYPYYINDELPESIIEFEKIAEHYNLNSVNVGKIAFEKWQDGLVRFDEWLPDGLHPSYRGSSIYSNAVKDLFTNALATSNKHELEETKSMTDLPWNNIIEPTMVNFKGPWIKKTMFEHWVDDFYWTSSPNAEITVEGSGSYFVIGNKYGPGSSEIQYSINDGQWISVERTKESWIVGQSWYRQEIIENPNPSMPINIRIKFINDINNPGTNTIITHMLFIE